VLFDGDPASPDLGALWTMAAETGITSFGASAPYLMACRRAQLDLRSVGDLSAIHTVGSTGAPLPAEGFRWVYEQLGPDIVVASISGDPVCAPCCRVGAAGSGRDGDRCRYWRKGRSI
jgi:acetoacetyl-CoA synthetase